MYKLQPKRKLSSYLKLMLLIGAIATGLLAYDIYQFKSLMLYVFTGIK